MMLAEAYRSVVLAVVVVAGRTAVAVVVVASAGRTLVADCAGVADEMSVQIHGAVVVQAELVEIVVGVHAELVEA